MNSEKNKNKKKPGDDKGLDYSWPQQDEASGFVYNKSRESLKDLEAWGRSEIKPEMKDFVDLQTVLAAAELAELHPHIVTEDLTGSARTKKRSPNKRTARCTGYIRKKKGK